MNEARLPAATAVKHFDEIVNHPNGRGVIAVGDAHAAVQEIDKQRWALIVYCAQELPPPAAYKPRDLSSTMLYHAGIDDAELSPEELVTVMKAAELVAGVYAGGRKVLVTCIQGRNRSPLVTALALHILSGCGGRAAGSILRAKRTSAPGQVLVNPSFLRFLGNLEATRDVGLAKGPPRIIRPDDPDYVPEGMIPFAIRPIKR